MSTQRPADYDAPRFYMGLGIDQRRCAACAVAPTLPCAAHRDHEPCTGAGDCPSRLHEHGCYADLDGSACNDPDDHGHTPIPPAKTEGER